MYYFFKIPLYLLSLLSRGAYLVLSLLWWHSTVIELPRDHQTPTFSLAFSPCGRYLLAGGTNDLNVWKLSSKKRLAIRNVKPDMLCDVTCTAWLTLPGGGGQLLCYTTIQGHVVLLKLRNETFLDLFTAERIFQGDQEVTCLTIDDSGPDILVAVGTRDSRMIIWHVDLQGKRLSLHSSKKRKQSNLSFPMALAFDGGVRKDIFVFGVQDGLLQKIGTEKWETVQEYCLESMVGRADIDISRRICVIDTVTHGFFVYIIRGGAARFIKHLSSGTITKRTPKVVKFFNESRMVVGGSDHGLVYIFETNTGKVLHKLQHTSNGGAEVVAVHDLNENMTMIASASSTCYDSESSAIRIHYFRKRRDRNSSPQRISSRLFVLFKALTVATLIFLVCFVLLGSTQDEHLALHDIQSRANHLHIALIQATNLQSQDPAIPDTEEPVDDSLDHNTTGPELGAHGPPIAPAGWDFSGMFRKD